MTEIDKLIKHIENYRDGNCVVQLDALLAEGGNPLVYKGRIDSCNQIIAALRRTAEDDKAREEGRLIILPPPANEGDPKPGCFYNDCSGLWCLGQTVEGDDEPCERCKRCWYCESGDYADDGPEADLGGGEGV